MRPQNGAAIAGAGRPARQIRLAIADNRSLIGYSLAALIGSMEGFAVTAVHSTEQALSEVAADPPDVLLVGVGSDRAGPLELARSLRPRVPDVEIVLLADVLVPELATFVLHERLNGLILADTPPHDLAAVLEQVARGHAVLPAGWHHVLARTRDDPLASLSERQLDVLELVVQGFSYEEIGARLFISPNTVKFHLRTIYLRLGVRNRVAAARLLSERAGAGLPVSRRRVTSRSD